MAYMFVTLYARSDNAHFKVFMSQICFWNPIVNGIKIMAFLTTGRIGKILPIFKISHPVKRISPKHFPQYILCSRERFGNKVMRGRYREGGGNRRTALLPHTGYCRHGHFLCKLKLDLSLSGRMNKTPHQMCVRSFLPSEETILLRHRCQQK